MNRRSFVQWTGSALAALGIARKIPAQPTQAEISVPWKEFVRFSSRTYPADHPGITVFSQHVAVPIGGALLNPSASITFVGLPALGHQFFVCRQGSGPWHSPDSVLSCDRVPNHARPSTAFWTLPQIPEPTLCTVGALSVPCPPVLQVWIDRYFVDF